MKKGALYTTLLVSFCLFNVSVLCISCKDKKINQSPEKISESATVQIKNHYYAEPYRPQFHFSPEENWMNDPNGMVYQDGVYHLFYQYYPDDIVWGPMHWGHATSKDLLHWEHQQVALYPDELGYIFSGSAVVDRGNTSGLGIDGQDPMVAIFTYHDPLKEKEQSSDYQTQGIAFSNDNGMTWNKYDKNPVISNPGKKDFRDPKVFWHQDSKKWIMSLAVGDRAEFYGSPDLIEWEFLSEFGKDLGAHGGVWECPDLIKVKVEGKEEYRWVLFISINPGGPNGGSATQNFVGDFDGKQFITEQKAIKWVDYGADNYAGVTFSNAPGGKHLFIGWMSNWNYAQEVPTKKWRSAMTLPRELSLIQENNDFFISSHLIPAFDELSLPAYSEEKVSLVESKAYEGEFDQAEISWEQTLNQNLDVMFKNELGEVLLLSIDPQNEKVIMDRTKSGKVEFNKSFADKDHVFDISADDRTIDIRIILDRSSIELFMDQGRYVMTELVFPSSPYTEMVLSSTDGAEIKELNIKKITNTWNNE